MKQAQIAKRLCLWSGPRCHCPVRLVHYHSASHSPRTEVVTPEQSYHPPTHPQRTPCPHPVCRMVAHVREIRRLSDASRLGSLKNKSSCAGLRCSLSFRCYPFPSHVSSVKVLYVSPPLGPCAALVGARVSTSLSSGVSLQLEHNTSQWAQTPSRNSFSHTNSHAGTTEYFA